MKPRLGISILSVALMQHGSALSLRVTAPPTGGNMPQRSAFQSRSTVYCGSAVMTKKSRTGTIFTCEKDFFFFGRDLIWELSRPKSLPRNTEDFSWSSHKRRLFITQQCVAERSDSLNWSQYILKDCGNSEHKSFSYGDWLEQVTPTGNFSVLTTIFFRGSLIIPQTSLM